ncbi:MAG: rhomboid family intramembrane serine protease [Bacteroidota bacterium]
MSTEQREVMRSLLPGLLLCTLLLCVHVYRTTCQDSLMWLGLFPRSAEQVHGILTFPLVHDDWEHVLSNTIPLFVLMALLRYHYATVWVRVSLLNWILSGIWLWLGGRSALHIGASGFVYGLASFLFFSGLYRWGERRSMAISLVVVFLYGGLVWGLFPFLREVSWEGHLFGGLSGILLAWTYRKQPPQRLVYEWELDSTEDDVEPEEYSGDAATDHEGLLSDLKASDTALPGITQPIHYIFTPNEVKDSGTDANDSREPSGK